MLIWRAKRNSAIGGKLRHLQRLTNLNFGLVEADLRMPEAGAEVLLLSVRSVGYAAP